MLHKMTKQTEYAKRCNTFSKSKNVMESLGSEGIGLENDNTSISLEMIPNNRMNRPHNQKAHQINKFETSDPRSACVPAIRLLYRDKLTVCLGKAKALPPRPGLLRFNAGYQEEELDIAESRCRHLQRSNKQTLQPSCSQRGSPAHDLYLCVRNSAGSETVRPSTRRGTVSCSACVVFVSVDNVDRGRQS